MDPRLKKALNNVAKQKENKLAIERAGSAKKAKEHEEYIKSRMGAAESWVNENLFDKIAKIELEGAYHKYIELPEQCNGIPAEAIIRVASKIDGIKATMTRHAARQSDDYQDDEPYTSYTITWEKLNK